MCPKKIVSTIIDDDENPEVDKLKDQLEIEKAKITALALKAYEEQKQELLDSIKDPEKREEIDELIQSGEDLRRVQTMVGVIQSGLSYGLSPHETPKKKKPSGQAKMWSPSNKDVQTWESAEEMVNHIYDELEKQLFKREMGKNYDAKKLKKYQSMANRLMSSLITGFRNRQSTNVGKMIIQECPNCGKINTKGVDKCISCGRRIMVGTPKGWR